MALAAALAIKTSHEFPICIEPDIDVPLAITFSFESVSINSSAILSIQCLEIYITKIKFKNFLELETLLYNHEEGAIFETIGPSI